VRGLGVFHVEAIYRDFGGRTYLENVKFKVRETSKAPRSRVTRSDRA
jgi:hypothetical protein